MDICILGCPIGNLKIKVRTPKFTIETSKDNCIHNGHKCTQSIANVNEDSIISYNKNILKVILKKLPDNIIENIIIDYLPLKVLFVEMSLSDLKILTKSKIFNYVTNELHKEKYRYHQEKNYYMYNDNWEYKWCKDCFDRVEEEIIKFTKL